MNSIMDGLGRIMIPKELRERVGLQPGRYGTSVAIADAHFPNATNFVAATGVNWPDSIAAGPFSARRGAPVLLSETHNFNEIPSRYMVAKVAPGNRGWVVGGPAAVGAAAEWDFRSVLPK
jgi:hypothetical protein